MSNFSTDKSTPPSLAERVSRMQIVVAAMALSVLTTAAVAIGVRLGKSEPELPPDTPVLTYAAVGVASVVLLSRTLVLGVLTSASRQTIAETARSANREISEGDFAAAWAQQIIISTAMLEAPALLGAVAYLVEGNWLAVGIAGVLLLGIVANFPTRSGAESWVAYQARRVESGG